MRKYIRHLFTSQKEDGATSLSRFMLILIFTVLMVYWVYNILHPEVTHVPETLIEAFWSLLGYEIFKKGNVTFKELKVAPKVDNVQGGSDAGLSEPN